MRATAVAVVNSRNNATSRGRVPHVSPASGFRCRVVSTTRSINAVRNCGEPQFAASGESNCSAAVRSLVIPTRRSTSNATSSSCSRIRHRGMTNRHKTQLRPNNASAPTTARWIVSRVNSQSTKNQLQPKPSSVSPNRLKAVPRRTKARRRPRRRSWRRKRESWDIARGTWFVSASGNSQNVLSVYQSPARSAGLDKTRGSVPASASYPDHRAVTTNPSAKPSYRPDNQPPLRDWCMLQGSEARPNVQRGGQFRQKKAAIHLFRSGLEPRFRWTGRLYRKLIQRRRLHSPSMSPTTRMNQSGVLQRGWFRTSC